MVEPARVGCHRPVWPPEVAVTEGLSRPSAGASKPKSRRSTFGYIVKPEVVAIGGRRCGHHGSTAGRDANAVACRMDCAGLLWVAISVAWSGCLTGARGRTSKLTIYVDLNIGSPGGPGSWLGCLGSGGAHWGGL